MVWRARTYRERLKRDSSEADELPRSHSLRPALLESIRESRDGGRVTEIADRVVGCAHRLEKSAPDFAVTRLYAVHLLRPYSREEGG